MKEVKPTVAADAHATESSADSPAAAFSGSGVVDEHFLPGAGVEIDAYIASGDLTAIHHLTRYRWAQAILRQRSSAASVLDLGCGSGYGTFLLAGAQPQSQFLGIDYDPQAISEAARHYSLPNLAFATGNPTDWEATIGDTMHDVVTCFDVLEHVKHRELLLEGLTYHLRQDGWLLLSTPCGHAHNVLEPGWEHHRIEYSAASLYDLLRRYFAVVRRADEPSFPERWVFEDLHSRGIEYLLYMNPVLCSEPIRLPNPYRR